MNLRGVYSVKLVSTSNKFPILSQSDSDKPIAADPVWINTTALGREHHDFNKLSYWNDPGKSLLKTKTFHPRHGLRFIYVWDLHADVRVPGPLR